MGLLSVPLKTVLLYYATTQNEGIPESYAVCDGTTLTSTQQDINPGSTFTLPDLRNRFILGADITKAVGNTGGTTNAATDAPGPGGVGGAHTKSLVVAELAAHNHTGTISSAGAHSHTGSSADSGGAHIHTATASTGGAHVHSGSTSNTTGAHTHTGSTSSGTAASAGSHTHTLTDPGHQHTILGGSNANAPAIPPNFMGTTSGSVVVSTAIQSATTGISLASGGAHTHSVSSTLTIASDGNHSHTLTIASDGDHTHTIIVASAGAHTHTLTIVSDGAHTHTFTGNNTGSGQAWDTRPRYFGLVFIMKVKI